MAIDIGNKRRVILIDRTIPEAFDRKKLSRLDIIELSWSMKSLGADIIEITSEVLVKTGKLPKGIDYMVRINTEEDIMLIQGSGIKNIVLDKGLLYLLPKLAGFNPDRIFVECHTEGLNDLNSFLKGELPGLDTRKCVFRFIGLNRCISPSWAHVVEKIRSRLAVEIDICPQNHTNFATSIAVEALRAGFEYISASFLGIGKPHGYAPVEEVLMAAKVMVNAGMKAELDLLPGVCGQFSKITGIKIQDNKPIVGKSIFHYESGVHADGIDKNPITYEPFEPQLVGQKRKLSIGKHSGRKSVEKKLAELGISYLEEEMDIIVQSIRKESVKLGRSLEDSEIVRIFLSSDVAGM